jgi:hypothetical protein
MDYSEICDWYRKRNKIVVNGNGSTKPITKGHWFVESDHYVIIDGSGYPVNPTREKSIDFIGFVWTIWRYVSETILSEDIFIVRQVRGPVTVYWLFELVENIAESRLARSPNGFQLFATLTLPLTANFQL